MHIVNSHYLPEIPEAPFMFVGLLKASLTCSLLVFFISSGVATSP